MPENCIFACNREGDYVMINNFVVMRSTLLVLMALWLLASCALCKGNGESAQIDKGQVVEDVIMSRRSIRNYKPVAVARDTMELILKAGINAPNGQNKQSWEVRVIDNPAIINEFKEEMAAKNPEFPQIGECFRGAPVMVFIAADTSYDFSKIDCALLAENMIIRAWSMGVGSIALGSPVRFLEGCTNSLERLQFSDGYKLVLCVGFGYPNEAPEAKPRKEDKYRFID